MADKHLDIMITGAGSGLGRGAALTLAARGHRVLAAVQFPQQVTELRAQAEREGLDLRVEKVDLARERDIVWLAGQPADVLVNNAAVSETGPIAEQPLDLVREVFDTNVFATLALTQRVVRSMVARGRGRIVFVSSMAGLMPIPYVGAYCASKHAIEAIAGAMQAELAPHGIEIVTVQPGPYRTGFNDRMWDAYARWLGPDNFTRPEDMAGTAAILDSQFDADEAIRLLADAVDARKARYRNVFPKPIEDLVRERQEDAWVRSA